MKPSSSTETAQQPIFIVGSCRSGTEMTRSILAMHPGIAMREYEQTYIWKHDHLDRVSDRVTPDEVSENGMAYIRRRFAQYQRENGPNGGRVAEKTCGNAFRVPLIDRVFPDAQIVHIIRDGRAAAVSARHYWLHGGKINVSKAMDLPVTMLVRKGFGLVGRKIRKALTGKVPLRPWGPTFDGIEEALRKYSLIEVCGLQWKAVVETAHEEGTLLGPQRYLEFHYEQFCRNPKQEIGRVLEFLKLPRDPKMDTWLEENVRTSRIDAWREKITEEDLQLLLEHIGPTLRRFGYE